ncbi:hypothetical protein F7725_000223 [Dissostichus mawsoni]|uniref:SAND domain-containing protein n=1 Tax=Dissostichus mawsoni TaxID=36200 RepID=A0A7J5ZHU2_DISMA|nr:hypothetical protein F7725_000223 [Dissostichus mawsoni]
MSVVKLHLSSMASSEVSMQDMREIVIVTIPDNVGEELSSVGEEEEKAVLVSAELSAQTGEEILTEASVDAEAEANRTDSMSREEAVIVKLSEEVDVEADEFYNITCGDTKATLVWKKFVCPGINVKCVQFNGQLISPKEFVKIMDSGELDFYQHSKVCSNTCRSTKIDLVGAKVSISTDQSADLVPAPPSSADLNGAAVSFPEAMEETSEWVTAIGEDSVTFWRSVKDAGLMEEVVEDFQKELQEVLKGLQERVCDPPAAVQNFGMLDLVKKVLASHKSQMDRYREQYTRSLAALEQQCDEHRKRAKELKSKSQHLNNVLMTLAPVPAPPTPKRPRLTRAVSGPASSTPPHPDHSEPDGGASDHGRRNRRQPGGYTLLTSSLSGSELTGDASNLTVLSAAAGGQEGAGGSLLKLMGPQFQLVTMQSLSSVQQQAGTISVLETTATAADDSQEECQADGDGGGQPEQVKEEGGRSQRSSSETETDVPPPVPPLVILIILDETTAEDSFTCSLLQII